MLYGGIDIEWLHHDCFRFSYGNTVVYTDPYIVSKDYNDASVVLISHDHYDHLDVESLSKLVNNGTKIVAPKDCSDILKEFNNEKTLVVPSKTYDVAGMRIETVPSYNVNKFKSGREASNVFHPKSKGNVGYIFSLGGIKIYIAGDTDFIPEMKTIKVDIALLPVSGIYVMAPDEAKEAAITINAGLTIPMHYGSGIGTVAEAKRFKSLVGTSLKIEVLEPIE